MAYDLGNTFPKVNKFRFRFHNVEELDRVDNFIDCDHCLSLGAKPLPSLREGLGWVPSSLQG